MTSQVPLSQMAGLSILIVGGGAIGSMVIKQAFEHPILATSIAATTYGFYRLIDNCMSRQTSSSDSMQNYNITKIDNITNIGKEEKEEENEINYVTSNIGTKSERLENEKYDEFYARRLQESYNSYNAKKIAEMPKIIQTGLDRGIQNKNLSCAIASFLYTFIATDTLDHLLLVDQVNDNQETRQTRTMLRQIVKQLRSENQYVNGETLVKLRKLVMPENINGDLTVTDFWSKLIDKLKPSYDEFLLLGHFDQSDIQEIVNQYLNTGERKSSEFDFTKKQAIFFNIAGPHCKILREINILGEKYRLTSIVGYEKERAHMVSWVFKKNCKMCFFDSHAYVDKSGTVHPGVFEVNVNNEQVMKSVKEKINDNAQGSFLTYTKV